MNIIYDKIAKAAYIKLRGTKITKTVKMTDSLLFDLDKNKKIVGIEILNSTSKKDIIEFSRNLKEVRI